MTARAVADCVFCEIIAGRTAGHLVVETPRVVAFLDHRPLFPGHCLVVPRHHHETLLDLPEAEVGPFFSVVKRVTAGVTRGMGAAGTFVAMNNKVSQSVPHLHVHVVPRNRRDGLRGFFWPRRSYGDQGTAADIARRIHEALPPDPA